MGIKRIKNKRKIETLDDLRLDSKNANKGTQRGLAMLSDSIGQLGMGRSILADKNGVIIAGNKTFGRANDAGIKKIQTVHTTGDELVVVVRDDLDLEKDDRAMRLAIADNRVAEIDLDWNVDVLKDFPAEVLDGFWDKKELELLGVSELGVLKDVEPQIDRANELQKKWHTATGQLWAIGDHRLLIGDSTKREDVETVMGEEKADCVFTSPPYAVGVDYGETYQDTIDNLRFMLPKLSKLWRDFVVCDGGFAVINFGDIAPARNIAQSFEPCEYPMAVEYWPVFRADGWLLWSRRIWCKPNARVNSMWCIGSNRAATDWEYLWTWRKAGEPIMKRVDGEFSSSKGWIDTTLLHGVDVGKGEHGAGMALGIVDWMLTTHSRSGGIVHEPFAGSGTTLISCQNLDRRGRAIEISEKYCAIILQRMADTFPGIRMEQLGK